MAPVGERVKLLIAPDWDVINAVARGVDQALEPRGRALSGRSGGEPCAGAVLRCGGSRSRTQARP